ncbi:MAG: tRNA lysidine(34) synthetase TilS, partial [bacterium]
KDRACKYHNYEFRWSIIDHQSGINLESKANVEFVDFDRTGSQVYLRTLQPGDRFIPLHFTGQKKVADYFSDKKIPHHVRTEIPILEASKGIVWICGHCIDDRFKITSKTTRLLKMEIIEQFNAT